MTPCPCTSSLQYRDCCAPYHRGDREAPDPESLMRSRFAAFALRDAEYLWRTLHASHEDRARPKVDVLRDLDLAARAHRYMRLAILDKDETRVLFRAGVFAKGKDLSFVELSDFAHDGVGWRYVGGTAKPASSAGLTIATFAP